MTGVLVPAAGRDEWLAARRQGVTASEIAVIMGLAPPSWGSAFRLYHQKRGDLPEDPDTLTLRIGRHYEPLVCDLFAEAHPEFRVVGTGTILYRHPARLWAMATPDRLVHDGEDFPALAPGYEDPVAVLEGKTSATSDGYGGDGSDEFPVYYRCQLLWQMDVLGVTTGFLACLFTHTRTFRVYQVTMDAEADNDLEIMRAEAEAFLDRVRDGLPPPPDWRPATTAALKTLHPDVEDTMAVIPRALGRRYQAACAAVKAAGRRKGLAENEIRDRIGPARVVVTASRGNQDTRVIATRQVYTTKEHLRRAGKVDKLVPAAREGDRP